MLEIIFGLMMAQISANKAHENGRNPYLFYMITIVIILALEFFGLWISLNYLKISQTIITHLIVLVFGGIGGIVGVSLPIIFKKDKEKYELSDDDNIIDRTQDIDFDAVIEEKEVESLNKPCKIIIKREKSFYACLSSFNIKLNGKNIGLLSNGKQLIAETLVRNNTITAQATNGANDTIEFSINGKFDCIEIYFKGEKFLKNKIK